MKNHILLIFITTLLYSFTSLSQSNSYFSDGESWAGLSWTTQFGESFYFHSVGDTIIENDTLVKVLRVRGNTTFLLMKNDTGVLIGYYSNEGFTDTLYKTIIDYSRTDSITSKWSDVQGSFHEYNSFKISEIDTMYFSGKPVKVFNIDDGCDDPDIVYEGTFMWPQWPYFHNCFEVQGTMTCYSSHGITYNVNFFNFTQDCNGECFLENVATPEHESPTFNIYPNPATDQLTIESQRATEIKITNMYGQIIYTANKPEGTKEIDVTGLKRGVYLIHSTFGESQRFIKL